MEIKIVKEKDNPFFKRKDLVLNIIHSGESTPKTDDLKKELVEKYKVDISQVAVKYIMTKGGLNESSAKVRILNEKPIIVKEEKEKAGGKEESNKEETKEGTKKEPEKEPEKAKEDKKEVEDKKLEKNEEKEEVESGKDEA